ncbi:MAG: hypothetical protein JKY01_08565, partial [Pseudomonadales bacterium]|nr:hypothetical protein [Pseudomonadales bacterium]
MSYSIPFISHFVGALGFLGLTLAAIIGWRRRDSGRALIIASLITAAWSLSIAAQSRWGFPSFSVRFSLESLRNLAWAFLLLRVLGLTTKTLRTPRGNPLFLLAISAGGLTLLPLITRVISNLFDFSNV